MTATPRTKNLPAPTLGVPAAPPLPEDLEALLRRLRLPHIRRHAPEVVATAKAQRWEPVEVLRALFTEEAAGRERSALATRRATAGFPTGKTFQAWSPQASSIPAPTQQAGLPPRARHDLRLLTGAECSHEDEAALSPQLCRGLGSPRAGRRPDVRSLPEPCCSFLGIVAVSA